MDYQKVIEDLNTDIYEEFGVRPSEDGYVWLYMTNGYIDSIFFCGIEIFNSEKWNIDSCEDVSNLSMSEFEDLLEERVWYVGKRFLYYSFMPRASIED